MAVFATLQQNVFGQCEIYMNKETQLYKIVWTQTYVSWPEPAEPQEESNLLDLTLAREVLARIMAK